MDDVFEITLGATADVAEAGSIDASLIAAATLVDDAHEATGQSIEYLRETLVVTLNGAHCGIVTVLAQYGHVNLATWERSRVDEIVRA